MNTSLKKILIILIVVLIIVLAGLLAYNFLLKKAPSEGEPGGGLPGSEEGEEQGEEPGAFQPQAETKIKVISQNAVLSPSINANKNKVVYYLKSNGNVWENNFDGSDPVQISDSNLENLVKVIWSPDKSNVITIFQDNLENVSKYSYNYTTSKAIPLNKYINYIAWSPDSKKNAYQYQNDFTDDNNISTANPDGTKYSILMNTRMKNMIVEWPQGTDVFLREKPSGLAQSSLYSLNTITKSFNKIIADVYGFSVKWSQKGEKILYSATNEKGKNIGIFIADRNGANKKALDISTLAEKCAWSQDVRYIYCAIAKNINDAKTLPDDFYKGTFVGDDEFYKINTETGEKTNILEGETINNTYDVSELFLAPEENYLLFIDRKNGWLYSIEL